MPEKVSVLQLIEVAACFDGDELLDDLSSVHKVEIHDSSASITNSSKFSGYLKVKTNNRKYICEEVNYLYGAPEEIY